MGFILDTKDLLKQFDLDHNVVKKIVSFLGSKATRKLRERKEIFIDAVSLLYSIPRTCEVRGENPRRVVFHLRKYLPHGLFFDDDINYEFYPEMVLAVSQVLTKDFRPSTKLLVMAYLARVLSRKIREIVFSGERYNLFWTKTMTEFFRFLYDLRVEVRREEGGLFPLKVFAPKFMVALIIDGDRTSDMFLENITAFGDFVLLIVVWEEKAKIFYPKGAEIGPLREAMSGLIDAEYIEYEANEDNLTSLARLLKHVLMERPPETWKLGSIVYDLLRVSPELSGLLSSLNLRLDYTFTIADKPEKYAPSLVAIYTALKRIGHVPAEKPMRKISKEMSVSTREPQTAVLESSRWAVPSPKKRRYSPRILGENLTHYLARKVILSLLEAGIDASGFDEDFLLAHIVLSKIFDFLQNRAFTWSAKIVKAGGVVAFIYLVGTVEGTWYALLEVRTETEKLGSQLWKKVGQGIYAIRTLWDTVVLLLIAKSREELIDKIDKAITLSGQFNFPALKITFDDCGAYVEDVECTLREALIIIETQNWWCKGNFIRIQNTKNETIQLIRVGNDKYILDVPMETSEKIEIHRATASISQLRRIIMEFAYGKNWKKYCRDLKLAFIIPQKGKRG